MIINVVEPVTEQNFDALGYTMANRDISIFVEAGNDPREHYRLYGYKEGRCQISSVFLERRPAYLKAKFDKFKDILSPGTKLTFAEEQGRFPIVIDGGHFSKDAYTFESSHPQYRPFEQEIEKLPDGFFMDLGSGFSDRVHDNCLYVEVYPSLTADIIVTPECTYPIQSNMLDGIGCFAVLEHTKFPWIVATDILRMTFCAC
jgi:hypothetical protein